LGRTLNAPMPSGNWSGYAVTGGNGAFHSVSASWIQPKATCRSASVHAYAAFWVGLDGAQSASVEQTGADSDCRGRSPTYYGWYEMFPAAPVFFRTRLNPGDHMSASVTFLGAGRGYALVLRDSTQRWTHTIIKHKGGLARSSAEVITEAPSSQAGVLPLADFGAIHYTGSTVNGVLLRRLARTRIIMVDQSGRQLDATSLVSSADAFANFWLRSS
jgi:hypothetical protein